MLLPTRAHADFVCSRSPSVCVFVGAELRDVSLLLIVVAKGEMGDTFPSASFSFYDQRAVHTNGKLTRSTFIQQVGRVFGFESYISAHDDSSKPDCSRHKNL